MSAQSLASFCCSSRKRWCSWQASHAIARSMCGANRRCEARVRGDAVEGPDGEQPPQRGIDATEVPEVGLRPATIDELRDLAVGGLVLRQGRKPALRPRAQRPVAGERHADRADRRIAREHRAIPARFGAGRGRGGEDAVVGEVRVQQRDRAHGAFGDAIRVASGGVGQAVPRHGERIRVGVTRRLSCIGVRLRAPFRCAASGLHRAPEPARIAAMQRARRRPCGRTRKGMVMTPRTRTETR